MRENTMQYSAKEIAYIAIFATIMAVCSWISIPTAIPFTLQTFGIFFAVCVLGGKRGSMAFLTFLLLGMIGIPVFSGFRNGMAVLPGPAGGYLIGYLFAVLFLWGTERWWKVRRWLLIPMMFLGMVICYAVGTWWFIHVYVSDTGAVGIWTALTWCVFPYVLGDMVKIILAYMLSRKVVFLCK